jgi:hypothetical protein
MPFYPDTETLCDVMMELFRRMMANPAAMQNLHRKHVTLRLEMTEPVLSLTVNGRAQPPTFSCDGNAPRADLVMHMQADVLHQIWLSEIRLRDAYHAGKIKVQGSLLKALSMADLFRQVEALYPQVLRDKHLRE